MPLERSRKPVERFKFKPYTKARATVVTQGDFAVLVAPPVE